MFVLLARKVTWRRGNHSLLLIAKVFVDAMRFVFVNKSALRGDFVNKCCSWVGVEGRSMSDEREAVMGKDFLLGLFFAFRLLR